MKLEIPKEVMQRVVACGFALGCLALGLEAGAVAALLAVLLK